VNTFRIIFDKKSLDGSVPGRFIVEYGAPLKRIQLGDNECKVSI
jgi:hypothetical protein